MRCIRVDTVICKKKQLTLAFKVRLVRSTVVMIVEVTVNNITSSNNKVNTVGWLGYEIAKQLTLDFQHRMRLSINQTRVKYSI